MFNCQCGCDKLSVNLLYDTSPCEEASQHQSGLQPWPGKALRSAVCLSY